MKIANLVQYSIGNSTVSNTVVWGDTPLQDLVEFETNIVFTEDEIPIEITCPVIKEFKILDTWPTQPPH